jgi:hypothetical protein
MSRVVGLYNSMPADLVYQASETFSFLSYYVARDRENERLQERQVRRETRTRTSERDIESRTGA